MSELQSDSRRLEKTEALSPDVAATGESYQQKKARLRHLWHETDAAESGVLQRRIELSSLYDETYRDARKQSNKEVDRLNRGLGLDKSTANRFREVAKHRDLFLTNWSRLPHKFEAIVEMARAESQRAGCVGEWISEKKITNRTTVRELRALRTSLNRRHTEGAETVAASEPELVVRMLSRDLAELTEQAVAVLRPTLSIRMKVADDRLRDAITQAGREAGVPDIESRVSR